LTAPRILHICYREKYTEQTVRTKFLCLQIDNHINWKNHTEEMIPKLSGECCAIRSMVHTSNINTLKSNTYAYFHSFITYGIIFGVTLPTVGKFSLYKSKSSELWLIHNREPLVEVCLNSSRFYLLHASIYIH